jgi:hypothetical protein
VLLVALATWFVVSRPDRTPAGSSSVKGGPAASIIVKRGERVFRWDGKSPVRPGDGLRLETRPAGFTRVLVVHQPAGRKGPGRKLEVLYTGRLRATERQMLPAAWKVDDAPGPERLWMILSSRELTLEDAEALVLSGQASPDRWIRRFDIPKQTIEEDR